MGVEEGQREGQAAVERAQAEDIRDTAELSQEHWQALPRGE